jgi:hypothetical protein
MAGAISCQELAVLAQRRLKVRGAAGTIEEWWEYAYRRSWIEEHTPGRCRLTSMGRQDLEKLRKTNAVTDPAEVAKAILRWVAPGGSLLLIVALVVERHPTVAATILIIAIAAAVMLFIAAPSIRLLDRWLDRSVARRACRWLEDEHVRFGPPVEPGTRASRIYPPSETAAPGLGQRAPGDHASRQ